MNEVDSNKYGVQSIGELSIGSDNPILIQSMVVNSALNMEAVVSEIIRLYESGCPLIRLAIPSQKEAMNLEVIKKELAKRGLNIPLVADIHFTPKAAEIAAKYVEKIRINPGNFADKKRFESKYYTEKEYQNELTRIEQELIPFIQVCKKFNRAVRIGVNHGSLSDRIMSYYGDTVKGMVASAIEYVELFSKHNFHNLSISLKSSNPKFMIEANREFQKWQSKNERIYPLHLGVTEAGEGEDGRIKSALGIGTLLSQGIGDTIRVSLTEDPEEELPVARFLAKEFGRRQYIELETVKWKPIQKPQVIFDSREIATELDEEDLINFDHIIDEDFKLIELSISDVDGLKSTERELPILLKVDSNDSFVNIRKALVQLRKIGISNSIYLWKFYESPLEEVLLQSTVDFGAVIMEGLADGICIRAKELSINKIKQLSFDILQATGRRISKTEFISCPSCGRTLFDLQDTTRKIKSKTSHLEGLKIGIMGCIVNGPGEMADVDYGYVGSGKGRISLYKKLEMVQKNVPEDRAVEALIDLIKKNGDWREP